jgi:8-oxo-dGTP diphosphatase
MVVITTPEGVVFLLDDAPQESVAFLPGGIVEYGETPEEAAIREAREETGLQVEIVRTLKRVFFQDFPFGPTLSFIFEARKVGGELREGLEGHPAVFQEREFPVITPARKGSQAALAAYLESKQQSVDPGALTVVAQWRE